MSKLCKLLLAILLALPITLFNVEIQEVSAALVIQGDYAYELKSDSTITIINYGGSDKNLEIPSMIDGYTVNEIGYGAFAECKSIETISLPETITKINNYAFSRCSQLKNIDIPTTITSLGTNVFKGCNALESASVPNSISELPYGTFLDCTNLTNVTIAEGIKTIGGMAFANCYELSEVVLPSTITYLGNYAFNNCVQLETMNIPNGTTVFGSGLFSGCLTMKSITLPDSLVTIGQSAFQDCISLNGVVLPESVTGIGYSAFSGCSSLTSIEIPSKIVKLTDAVFSGCSSLTSIILPQTLSEIGASTFSGCIRLTSIDLPDSIIAIGTQAFLNCSNLTQVNIPAGLSTIPMSMFRYCTSLESVYIPATITQIDAYAFADCLNLKSVSIPPTIKEGGIGAGIFSNSTNVLVSVVANSQGYVYCANEPNVNYVVLETGLNLDTSILSLNLNENYTYKVLMYPYNVLVNSDVTWTSSNEEVASVDENGCVYAHTVGTTTITVKNANGLSATSSVIVEDVNIKIESLLLSETSVAIKKNGTSRLTTTISPANTTEDKTITWTSSDNEVATVSATGVVTGRTPGTAVISAILDNGKTATCVVQVTSEISKVYLNLTAITLEESDKQTIRATIDPIDTTDDTTLVWKSSNESVATVDSDGTIEAITKGYATITVTTTNGKIAECKVTVNEKEEDILISSISLNKNETNIKVGNQETLEAQINPTNTTQSKQLTWESSNKSVATVDENGKISALSVGETTISVSSVNGKTASCVVTVYTIDKSRLQALVEKSETLVNSNLYVSSTVDALNDSIGSSNDVLNDDEASQEEIDKEEAKLQDKIDQLIEKVDSLLLANLNSVLSEAIVYAKDYTMVDLSTLNKYISETQILLAKGNDEVAKTDAQNMYNQLVSEMNKVDVLVAHYHLSNTISMAETIINGDLTSYDLDKIEILKTKVNEAKQLIDAQSSDLVAIENAKNNIVNAMSNIHKVIDLTYLNAMVEYAETLDASIYTESTFTLVNESLKVAKQLLQNFDTQVQITNAANNLYDAISGLKRIADKTTLAFRLEMVQYIVENKEMYQASSIVSIDELYEEGLAMYNSAIVSYEDVSTMATKLLVAVMKARLQ